VVKEMYSQTGAIIVEAVNFLCCWDQLN